jgi:hypothetical protein
MKKKNSNKLALKKDSVTILTSKQLTHVLGGDQLPTSSVFCVIHKPTML